MLLGLGLLCPNCFSNICPVLWCAQMCLCVPFSRAKKSKKKVWYASFTLLHYSLITNQPQASFPISAFPDYSLYDPQMIYPQLINPHKTSVED